MLIIWLVVHNILQKLPVPESCFLIGFVYTVHPQPFLAH